MPQQVTASPGASATGGREGGDSVDARRWWIFAILGIAQLMVVLDITVVNIALPSAQNALHFSNNGREWVVTAYALAFGSLLLAGGKIGDLFGRKRVFIASTIGFGAASALGGAAQSFGVLVAARGLQGVFAALMAPAALSLVSTTFTDPPTSEQQAAERERVRGHDPLSTVVGEMQRLLRRGQRDVDHRNVEHDHQLREPEDREDPPSSRVNGVSGLPALSCSSAA